MPYAAAVIRGHALNTIRTPRRTHRRSFDTSLSMQHRPIPFCSSVASVARPRVVALGIAVWSVLEEVVLVVAEVLPLLRLLLLLLLLLLLEEAELEYVVVVLLLAMMIAGEATSPATASASMSSKALSAVCAAFASAFCRLSFLSFFGILSREVVQWNRLWHRIET
jgi:hypothetical protein